MTTIMHGWALSEQGQRADGEARIRGGLATLADIGDKLFRLYYVAMLAEALGKAGRADEGLLALEEAIDGSRSLGLSYWDAAFYRLKGELLLAENQADAATAEACFGQAIEIAQAQSARSLELRAATSLARLWRDQDKGAEAHDLLVPVYSWFTEGLETQDLQDAKALLDELR